MKYTNVVPARTGALLIASTVYSSYLGNGLLIEYGINEYNLSGLAQDTITSLLQVVRDGAVSESYRKAGRSRETLRIDLGPHVRASIKIIH